MDKKMVSGLKMSKILEALFGYRGLNCQVELIYGGIK
jgi:hypothetical protein